MSWFGLNPSPPLPKPASTSSIIRQLDEVRNKVARTHELSIKYNQRLNDVNNLNKALAEGYINNIEVMVDISKLLIEYRNTLDVVLNVMGQFDSSFSESLKKSDVDIINLQTKNKLEQVRKFFGNDMSKIVEAVGMTNADKRESIIRKLKASERNFYDSLKESENLIKQGGKGKKTRKCKG